MIYTLALLVAASPREDLASRLFLASAPLLHALVWQAALRLWAALDGVRHARDAGAARVRRLARDARRRIAVDDSKKLKGSNQAKAHPLRHLERGVLSFLSTRTSDEPGDRGHAPPATDDALFALTGTDLPTTVATPWYQSNTALPVAHDADALAIDAARLDRGLSAAGVRLLELRCEAIDAGEFNRRLSAGSNKASINLDAVARHVADVRRASRAADPDAVPRIVCDRQGGRSHYREWLQGCFPDASIRILGATCEYIFCTGSAEAAADSLAGGTAATTATTQTRKPSYTTCV